MINISAYKGSIEGVTILGGEPMDQYSEMLELAKRIQDTGLSLMVFTGFEHEELVVQDKLEVLDYTDILVSGRYIEELRTTNHQWIGSTNQQIMFLSSRYHNYKLADTNYLEVSIDEFGKLEYLGFPDEFICGVPH